MATANEYRQFAQECIESARVAASDPVRQQFLELARLWLNAASKMDTGIALQPIDTLQPIDGKKIEPSLYSPRPAPGE